MNDTVEFTVGETRQINSALAGDLARLRLGGAMQPEEIDREASPRVLIASPTADDLVEDAQNEGCNI